MSNRISHELAKSCVLDALGRWGTWATLGDLVDDACATTEEPRYAVTEPVRAALRALADVGIVEIEDEGRGMRFRIPSATKAVPGRRPSHPR